MRLTPAMVLCLAMASTGAQAQSWQPVSGQGAAYLPAPSQGQVFGNPLLSCIGGVWTLSFATMAVPTGPNGEFEAPAQIIVDGQVFATTAQPTGEGNEMPVPVAALPSLRSGNRLTVQFASGVGSFSATFSLRGSGRAIDHALRLCGAAGPGVAPGAGSIGTPLSDPDRFLALGDQETPQAASEARAALASELAQNETMLRQVGAPVTQDVRAAVATWPDGRRLMLAHIGHETTAVYGGGGSGSFLLTAQPGQPWVLHLATTGLSGWIDTGAAGNAGWPDIWLLSDGGGTANRFGMWRWTGTAYAHVANVE